MNILSLVFSKTKFNWFHYIYLCLPSGSDSKESAAVKETQVQSLGGEEPLENRMAPHSSILAWRIPWTEEPVHVCVYIHTHRCIYTHTNIYAYKSIYTCTYIHCIYIYQVEDCVSVASILLVNRNLIKCFNKFILSNFMKCKYKRYLFYTMNWNSIYFNTLFNHNKEKWSHRHLNSYITNTHENWVLFKYNILLFWNQNRQDIFTCH